MKPYYNLSLHPGASNVCAFAGKITDVSATDEIILGHGEVLSLVFPDSVGKIRNLASLSFATSIRSIAHFRSPEGIVIILIGLNTGGFLSVKYCPDGPSFKINSRVHFDNPVQFLAADHQGRAILAVPRNQNKFFYVARDVGGPPARVEIPDSNTITYAVVALSGHSDEKNLCFAAIEGGNCYGGQTHIAYYEARTEGKLQILRSTVSVNSEASFLLAVPGGENGPGGILVCTKHMVIYKNYKKLDFPDSWAWFPCKHGLPEEHGALIVSATTCRRDEKHGLFYLLQTEFGDIIRVSLIIGRFGLVTGFCIKHIDTIPVTYAMCLLDPDILFAASKTGNHSLYQLSAAKEKLFKVDENERITDMGVMKLPEEKTPFIMYLCSQGLVFSLRKLWPGKKIGEVAETLLHERPNALWRVKKDVETRFTEFLAISYDSETEFMDMSLERKTQADKKDLMFQVKKPTLAVSFLGNDSMLHVHRKGIIHVKKDLQRTDIRNMEGEIVKVAYNRFQVVVALTGGKLIYYTVSTNDTLKVMGRRRMNSEVACLCIPQIPEGKNRSFCVAVGLADSTIMILALHPREPTEQVLEVLSVQKMLSKPESMIFLQPQEDYEPQEYNDDDDDEPPYHFLIAGMENGLLNTMVLVSSGRLWVLCSQYLGSRTPKLFSVIVRGHQAIICLSDRPWIGYMHEQRFLLTPLSCEAFDSVASICCHRPQGMAAVTGDRLKLFTIEDLGDNFSENTFCLDYTPESFALHREQELVIAVSNEQGEISPEDEEEEDDGKDRLPSHIMILDPRSGKTVSSFELQGNESAYTMSTVAFHNNGEYETLLVVAIGMEEPPIGFIRIYRISDRGKTVVVLRNTCVEEFPRALSQFRGALLAGIGPVLRMYDLGEIELHMRCEGRLFPDTCVIVSINVVGNRIYVEDNKLAMHCFKYSTTEGFRYVFEYGDVRSPDTAMIQIDSSMMAKADMLGNVFFAEIPPEFPNECSEAPSSSKGKGLINEVEEMCFHVEDLVTCLQTASLVQGEDQCVIYGTARGTLGAFLPLDIEDVELLSGLEKQIRQECPPLCSRSHWKNEYPKNCVIDGDICEKFQTLDSGSQMSIASKLGSTEIEILKKLGTIRNKII